jgi:small neutral amino acid transporter SnatA (MarC family)
MTAGQVILDAIGIHIHSLKVAGGIILFLFGSQCSSGKWIQRRIDRRRRDATWRCFRWGCLPLPEGEQ